MAKYRRRTGEALQPSLSFVCFFPRKLSFFPLNLYGSISIYFSYVKEKKEFKRTIRLFDFLLTLQTLRLMSLLILFSYTIEVTKNIARCERENCFCTLYAILYSRNYSKKIPGSFPEMKAY